MIIILKFVLYEVTKLIKKIKICKIFAVLFIFPANSLHIHCIFVLKVTKLLHYYHPTPNCLTAIAGCARDNLSKLNSPLTCTAIPHLPIRILRCKVPQVYSHPSLSYSP